MLDPCDFESRGQRYDYLKQQKPIDQELEPEQSEKIRAKPYLTVIALLVEAKILSNSSPFSRMSLTSTSCFPAGSPFTIKGATFLTSCSSPSILIKNIKPSSFNPPPMSKKSTMTSSSEA